MTEDADTVQVPAMAVAVAISHIGVAARILGGTPPRQAFDQSYTRFFAELAPRLSVPWDLEDWRATAVHGAFPRKRPAFEWLHDPHGGLAPRPAGNGPKWTTACFTLACEQNTGALRMTADQYARAAAWPDPPMTGIEPANLDRLCWMMNMMRIYASGGGGRDLCQCARTAADHAAGRPRQKRAPVDAEWLAAEVAIALQAAEAAYEVAVAHGPRGHLPAAARR